MNDGSPQNEYFSTNLASMVCRPKEKIKKIYLLKLMDSLVRVNSILGMQRV